MSSRTLAGGLMLLAAFGFVAFVNADIDINQLNVNELQNKLPAEFANANVSMDDVRTLFRDKCIEVAGDTNGTAAFGAIENGMTEFMLCFNEIVNFTAIQAEIAKASPNGELDVVFHKYCNKRPAAMECVETLNSKFVPCLDKEERENQDVFMRIINSLLNFVCHKGGDQIALFIAEQGPECLQSQQDEIQQCFNETFAGYVPKDGLESVKKVPKLVVDQKTCENMAKLETCIINKLERCSEITPANIVESMFRFIKNETICRNDKNRHYQHHMANDESGASAMHATLLSFILSLMLLLTGAKGKYFN